MIGKTISHYKIIDKLGSGGMGVVYKAEDTKLKRIVALKFLPTELIRDADAKARFIREAQAASALQHSNICTIHEIDETDDGQLFICMDHYEGDTLQNKINLGPLKIDEIIEIGIQVARGLAAAHEANEIHRDIKPANIMLTSKNEVKLLDFGLAKLVRKTKLTAEGTTLGTVAYMSPEQSEAKKIDHRTDIWSLGVVLYEMITGKSPFRGDYDQATVYSIMNENPEPVTAIRTGVPMELERIVQKAMQKNPAERYQHIDDLLVDLKGLRKDPDSTSRPYIASSVPVKPGKKLDKKYIISIALLLIFIVAYIFLKPVIDEEMAISDPNPIVVISFKNQTGDATYDYLQEAIPNLLITNLEQSKYVRVITWQRIQDLLKKIGKSNVNVIDQEVGFEICKMEGIESIVLGSFVKAGDVFATDVKVLDVESKMLIKSASARGEGVSSILQSQIDELSKEISRGINITETRINNTKLKISDVTTNSMESYHFFIRGRDAYDKLCYDDAEKFLTKAIRLDSTFAMAHLYLARAHSSLRQFESRDVSIEKARMYAKNTGQKEKMYIDASYATYMEKNPEKRLKILENMVEKFPKEKDAFMDLGWYYRGQKEYDKAILTLSHVQELDPNYAEVYNALAYIYGDMKQFEKADECLKRYSELVPGDANPYDSIAEYYVRIGNIDMAINKYLEAIEVKSDFGSESRLSWLYAFKEDYQSAILWTEKYVRDKQQSYRLSVGYTFQALYRYLAGQHRKADELLSIARNEADRSNFTWGIAFCDYFESWIALDLGHIKEARRLFNKYYQFRLMQSPQYLANHKADYAYRFGLMCLAESKTDSARFYLDKIAHLFNDLTPIAQERHEITQNFLYTQILINQDSLERAQKLRDLNITLERPFTFNLNNLDNNFPISKDDLAQAYLRLGKINQAIEAYKYLLEQNPPERAYRTINPRYHYELAKLYQQTGELEKAINQYTIFLKIWHNADKNLPQYIDAQLQLQLLTPKLE